MLFLVAALCCWVSSSAPSPMCRWHASSALAAGIALWLAVFAYRERHARRDRATD